MQHGRLGVDLEGRGLVTTYLKCKQSIIKQGNGIKSPALFGSIV